jgi:hypothetical protein
LLAEAKIPETLASRSGESADANVTVHSHFIEGQFAGGRNRRHAKNIT